MGDHKINSAIKRKEDRVKNELPLKKRKKLSNMKVQPPTAEEMNQLRETESVFHSNMFRLQIEEILKEIKMNPRTIDKLNSWITNVKNFLLNIDYSFSLKTSENPYFTIPNVFCPMKSKLKPVSFSFNFVKPKSVEVFGSYSCDCLMKNRGSIDISVEMPKEVFQKEDYLNEKYIRKRNIYLSCVASQLLNAKSDSLYSEIKYKLLNNLEKPVLQLKSADRKLEKYNCFIHVIPEAGVFKETRFSPSLNNIRYSWVFETASNCKMNYPTPFYNSIISQDVISVQNDLYKKDIFYQNPNFKDAFLLLKVWLHQRQLDVGLGSFNGFLLAMFMVYLHRNKKLNNVMSSYQIVRTVWLFLAKLNWHTDGISLADISSNIMNTFTSSYDVTFVDVTGSTNLASAVSLSAYLYLQKQSEYAVRYLDDLKSNNFSALFMTSVQKNLEFDHMICFNKLTLIRKVIKRNADFRLQLDYRSNSINQFLQIVLKLLRQALGQRVSVIFCEVEPINLLWSVDEKMPSYEKIFIGLNLDPEHAFAVIDRGPTANLLEAADFRYFWGSKSELRRFRDGDVCEAVSWARINDTLQVKRLIVQSIVKYILKEKLYIQPDQYVYIADQMETVVFKTYNEIFSSSGTGEEASVKTIASFLDLSQHLRKLENLPLAVTSTQGTSAVFRYSELFPTLPNVHANPKKYIMTNDKVSKFRNESTLKNVPLYISPIEAVIQLSPSNKWPEDLDAIRKLQAAFYVKLASNLRNTFSYVCQSYHNYIDVLKNGFVFRVRLANTHEISALKRRVNEFGEVEYSENEESFALEKSLIRLPYLTSAIHGLHQRNAVLGPACAIVKRWLRSQLIDDYYFPDVCVDLIIAYLCLNPQPYSPASHPQTMFFRFLKLISTENWFLDPLVINFNNDLTREEILEIDSVVNKNRKHLPALVLVTPFEKTGGMWTRDQPSLIILKKLSQLAEASLRVINGSLLLDESCSISQIFQPPIKGYDLLIWISKSASSSSWYSTLAEPSNLPAVKNSPEFEILPIVGFHPVRIYVNELRKHYGDQCLFFYDFYGGNFIGVVLKPKMKLSHDYKITNMACSKVNKAKLEFDLEAAVDDFRILGEGLVTSIEKCE